jgi:hypothetical protein
MRYRLIKTYPGSPSEIGYEVEIQPGQLHNWPDIQSSPEYWEFIQEPANEEPVWVIEEFRSCDGLHPNASWKLCKNNKYSSEWEYKGTNIGTFSLQQMMDDKDGGRCVKLGTARIQSARTTPQSPVIAIGDWIIAECTHMHNIPMQVKGFVINDRNNLFIKTRQFRTHGVNIANCRKVLAPTKKKWLFTTEDGVQVYDPEHIVWPVSDEWKTTVTPESCEFRKLHDGVLKENSVWHVFSTKEKAQEYIDSKKLVEKVDSVNDIRYADTGILIPIGGEYWYVYKDQAACSEDEPTPSQRWGPGQVDDKMIRFSTQMAAQRYIDTYKPKKEELIPVMLTQKEIDKLKKLIK